MIIDIIEPLTIATLLGVPWPLCFAIWVTSLGHSDILRALTVIFNSDLTAHQNHVVARFVPVDCGL
jgi:hypothetical protein